MIENSHIELDVKALKNNYDFIRKQLNPDTQLVSVVKGNAYGHGIEKFVPTAIDCGVESFAVFSAHEAFKVKQSASNINRIIVMGNLPSAELDWAVENNIEAYAFDVGRLKNMALTAAKLKTKAKVHIEIETGLNRTGFTSKELKEVFSFIEDYKEFIDVKGVCSHLAGAENIANYYRIKNQIQRFKTGLKRFDKNEQSYEHAHLACSAAMMNYPKTIYDMVRVGIMQYGLWPSKEVKMAYHVRTKQEADPLQPVLSWKSNVMSMKVVNKGEYIGYGSTLLAEQNMRIATVPVGYADGFARSLSNQGKVLINGHRLDVVATVNMNLFLVDVTNVENVKIGDEVVMIGKQGTQSISVASFSDFSSQLNYELLTRLPNDIPRLLKK